MGALLCAPPLSSGGARGRAAGPRAELWPRRRADLNISDQCAAARAAVLAAIDHDDNVAAASDGASSSAVVRAYARRLRCERFGADTPARWSRASSSSGCATRRSSPRWSRSAKTKRASATSCDVSHGRASTPWAPRGEVTGAQEARGRPLRTPLHPSRAARTPVRERGHNFWGRGHNLKRSFPRTARTVCHDSKLERRLKTPREGIMPSPRSGRLRGERAELRNRDD